MILFLVLLIGIPLAEIYVIVQVGSAIGYLPTFGLMLLTSLLGAWLLRYEGSRAWQAFNVAIAERRPPHREAIDGVLILFGAVFMLVPGFVSDAIGLVFLFPPTRWTLRSWLLRRATDPRTRINVIRVRSRVERDEEPPPRRVVEGELVDPDRPEDPDGGEDRR